MSGDPHSLVERAEHLRAVGRLDDAERTVREGLTEYPQDPGLLRGLAVLLLAADRDRPDRHEEGLAAAEAACAAEPDAEHPHRLRALHLSMLNRHGEALEAGYRAVTLAPDDRYAATGYARVLQRAGRLADAAQVARRVVDLAPLEAGSHFLLADVTSDLGDRTTARAAYTETLRLDPTHAGARHDLAVLDARSHHPGRALGGLVDAGRLAPGETGVLRTVAAVLWQLSWRLRLVLLVSVFVVLALSARPEGGTAGARIGAVAVLLVGALLARYETRELPKGAWPVIVAAVRADRPLAVTWVALGLCVALYVAVAVTGVAALAGAVWIVLLGLALLAVIVGVTRRNRTRR
ncbi:MAG: tetratricopeptide repeat protein [Pseudonocardia sediminis]